MEPTNWIKLDTAVSGVSVHTGGVSVTRRALRRFAPTRIQLISTITFLILSLTCELMGPDKTCAILLAPNVYPARDGCCTIIMCHIYQHMTVHCHQRSAAQRAKMLRDPYRNSTSTWQQMYCWSR